MGIVELEVLVKVLLCEERYAWQFFKLFNTLASGSTDSLRR